MLKRRIGVIIVLLDNITPFIVTNYLLYNLLPIPHYTYIPNPNFINFQLILYSFMQMGIAS